MSYMKKHQHSNPIIVSYNGTCCIYKSDLRLLESDTEWLNDNCINFRMTRLAEITEVERGKKKGEKEVNNYAKPNSTTTNCSAFNSNDAKNEIRFLFLDPSVVSFFMHQLSIDDEEDREEIIGLYKNNWGLGFASTSDHTMMPNQRQNGGGDKNVVMMIPINDNHAGSSLSFQSPGSGNHWSLLLVLIHQQYPQLPRSDVDNGDGGGGLEDGKYVHLQEVKNEGGRQSSNLARFFHFDSCKGCNSGAAKVIAARVEKILSIGGGGDRNWDRVSIKPLNQQQKDERIKPVATVSECQTPQQLNGYDCGLCTLANAQIISNGIIDSKSNFPHYGPNNDVSTSKHNDKLGFGYDSDDLQNWFEQLLIKSTSLQGGVSEMARVMRRNIAADVREKVINCDRII